MSVSSSSSSSSGGVGFAGLLAIVFITLKLTGVIDWTWYWVLAPIWIPGLIGLAIAVVALVIAVWVAKEERELRSHINRLGL